MTYVEHEDEDAEDGHVQDGEDGVHAELRAHVCAKDSGVAVALCQSLSAALHELRVAEMQNKKLIISKQKLLFIK